MIDKEKLKEPSRRYDEDGTHCIKCKKYFIFEELTLDDSTSESDGPEEYTCYNCIK